MLYGVEGGYLENFAPEKPFWGPRSSSDGPLAASSCEVKVPKFAPFSPGIVLDLREDCSDQMAECGLCVASENDLGTPKKVPKGKPILRTSHSKRQSGRRTSRTVSADP